MIRAIAGRIKDRWLLIALRIESSAARDRAQIDNLIEDIRERYGSAI